MAAKWITKRRAIAGLVGAAIATVLTVLVLNFTEAEKHVQEPLSVR